MKGFSIKDDKIAFDGEIVINKKVKRCHVSPSDSYCDACYVDENNFFILMNKSNPKIPVGSTHISDKNATIHFAILNTYGVVICVAYDVCIDFHYIEQGAYKSYSQVIMLDSYTHDKVIINSDSKHLYMYMSDGSFCQIIDISTKNMYVMYLKNGIKRVIYHNNLRYLLTDNGDLYVSPHVFMRGTFVANNVEHLELSDTLSVTTVNKKRIMDKEVQDALKYDMQRNDYDGIEYLSSLFKGVNIINADVIKMMGFTGFDKSGDLFVVEMRKRCTYAIRTMKEMTKVSFASRFSDLRAHILPQCMNLTQSINALDSAISALSNVSISQKDSYISNLNAKRDEIVNERDKKLKVAHECDEIYEKIITFCMSHRKYAPNDW